MSRFPFTPYPYGWFQIAYSDELKPGEVRPLRYFGRDLALFRTSGGRASLLDAHCPHLGAHLGHGGTVAGDCLRCPFHGWSFSAQGACVEIPYGAADPSKANVPAWALRELDGLVMAYFHPRGAAPEFELPVLSPRGEYVRRSWRIKTHIQEPLENLVDSAHFSVLHRSPSMPKARASFKKAEITMDSAVKMRGPKGLVDGTIEWKGRGMGYGVVTLRSIAETRFILCVTPVDAETVEARFTFILPEGGPPGFGEAVVRDISRQIEEDIPIWENKIYRPQPLLSGDEAAIMILRSWSKQFLL